MAYHAGAEHINDWDDGSFFIWYVSDPVYLTAYTPEGHQVVTHVNRCSMHAFNVPKNLVSKLHKDIIIHNTVKSAE